jgi:hypothetical protein
MAVGRRRNPADCTNGASASDSLSRKRGQLGHASLGDDEALTIAPCSAILPVRSARMSLGPGYQLEFRRTH